MKTITLIQYVGTKHNTVVVDPKRNPELPKLYAKNFKKPVEGETISDWAYSTIKNLEPGAEIIIQDYTTQNLKKLTSDQLLKTYEKVKESGKMKGFIEALEEVLIKRGKIEAPKPVKEEPTPKEPRELKKALSPEELQTRLAQARTNYGKVVRFICTKTKEGELGIIRSARLDKRSGFIQYRIEIIEETRDGHLKKTGNIFGKGDDSKALVFLSEEESEEVKKEISVKEAETKSEGEELK